MYADVIHQHSSLRRCHSDDLSRMELQVPCMLDIRCPITQEVPLEPVVAADGFTYERYAIKRWLAQSSTSPVLRKPMSHSLVDNMALRDVTRQLRLKGSGSLMVRYSVSVPSVWNIWRCRLAVLKSETSQCVVRLATAVTSPAQLKQAFWSIPSIVSISILVGALVGAASLARSNPHETFLRRADTAGILGIMAGVDSILALSMIKVDIIDRWGSPEGSPPP